MKAGRFVTLEGIEGSGKTQQMLLLEEELRRRAIPCLVTRQPGGTPLGEELREILLHRDGPPREPLTELLLYLADRYQHVKQVIEPALEDGLLVLCDRYHDATLAYQGYARGIGLERVDRLAEILQLRMPDLTLVLNLEVELSLQRARRRDAGEAARQWGRFEAESLDFHRRVQQGYLRLARREPERICVVEASGSPEEVFAALLEIVQQRGILE